MARREKATDPNFAETAGGFEVLLQSFRNAGGLEIEMTSLAELKTVAHIRSLPILKHDATESGGWVYYLVLDGAGRLAYRFTERERRVGG